LTRLYKVVGDRKIKDVRPSDIKEAYNQYLGRSQSTIRRARLIWVSMFDGAVADGLIRTNPARDKTAQPHKGSVGSHRAITQEERQLILETEHPLRPLVCLMLYAGLRRGEALAINVDEDVDTEAGVIRVNKAVRFDGNAPQLVDPKTEAGRREVPLLT
jgi:integrase